MRRVRLAAIIWTTAAALVVGAIAFGLRSGSGTDAEVAVVEPHHLSPAAAVGAALFEETCARCHGARPAGTDRGPPLVHQLYRPSHHADAAFQMAAQFGVRPHHWPYGPMPPLPGLSPDQIGLIIEYVREMQHANGIED